MRQLPRILLLTCAAIIVIVALLVSGLRLVMPWLNNWREPLLSTLSETTGLQMSASQLNGRWERAGPSLEARDVRVRLDDGGELTITRVNLALNVWQSLLHARLQFRDLTFYQLNLNTHSPLMAGGNEPHHFRPDAINSLFLHQFDHFILRDSQLTFPSPSGQRVTLSMPQLTWFNEADRHRAEGEVSLSSFNGQHGVLQVRMDLQDSNGLLNDGRVWMQADDVDVRPWLGQWMRDNTTLQSARFSLAAWMGLKDGEIYSGDLLLKRGGASWLGKKQRHTLRVDNQTAHLTRINNGWRLNLPQTHLQTDDRAWPQGRLDMLWQPENGMLPGPDHNAEFRLRATHLDLARLAPLIPLLSRLSPQLQENWQRLQPHGQIDTLALDVPLKQPEQTRFNAAWRNLSWQPWELLPGMEKLDGQVAGSAGDGQVKLALKDATLPYARMFKAPLEIKQFSGAINWQHGPQGLELRGSDIDLQARALWARGDFSWRQPQNASPYLDILAGISVSDASQAWRYFPGPLMGKSLVEYLSAAIQGGKADSATLLFSGNPQQFPFEHHEGMFEVKVPLREATFAFQPDWPSLQNLAIDLDFRNNGLWMHAPQAMLGKVEATNVSAVIPDYLKERLLIDGDLKGKGPDITDYFMQSSLKETLGKGLEQLPIGGEVSSRLHLDIPLDHRLGIVRASGDVLMQNNSLTIKPIGSTLNKLSGRFRYNNGDLQSEAMQAEWFGQPVDLRFSTRDGDDDFGVSVDLGGEWALNKIPALPAAVSSTLKGDARWQGKVAVTLPRTGHTHYQVDVSGDLNEVSSHLPPPLDKPGGSALPFSVLAKGGLDTLDVSGSVGSEHHFNSRWNLNKPVRIERGIWANQGKSVPALPQSVGMELNLPALDGDRWLALFSAATTPVPAAAGNIFSKGKNKHAAASTSVATLPAASQLPGSLTLNTPLLQLGGQQWHDLSATLSSQSGGGMQITAKGKEIDGSLVTTDNAPWNAHLSYLYYNPQWGDKGKESSALPPASGTIDFSRWPAMHLNCDQCWLRGQNFGRVQGSLTPAGDTLTLSDGKIDTGKSMLNVSGAWVNRPGEQRTSLKGKLSGKNINDAANWFGTSSPLRDAPFSIDYDLHWRSRPWQPSEETLSGTLKTHLGKGQIADVNTGSAGQILRLLSFDALLRKLRLDFSDTFSKGFAFDSINGTAWIENGVMHTDNLLVDGLEADIAMQGKIDLVRRQLDAEAVVAPEISTTVGVATAFAVNPVIGAAVFAASKVLGPLWNKISVLRYHISGPLDKPEINEVLRKPRENSAK